VHSVRLLEACGLLSLIAAFVVLSRRHLGDARAGLLAGALALLVHVQLEFWNTAQPSSFAAIVLAWALVCATFEPRRASTPAAFWKERAAWFAAGTLFGIAAILKPPLGGGIAVSATIVAARRARGASSTRSAIGAAARCFVVFAAGALFPLVAIGAYFAHTGAWPELAKTLFEFAPHYTALGLAEHSLVGLLGRALGDWAFSFSVTNLVGLFFLALLPPLHRREREGTLHVLGAVAAVLGGVALQAKFFPYHYGAALPLTALCAGWGLWKLWMQLRRSPVGAFAFALLLVALITARTATEASFLRVEPFWERCRVRIAALLDPSQRASANDQLHSLGDFDAGANRRLVEWLRDNTRRADTVFIWGFEPSVYYLAERNPASRYIYNVAQRANWDAGESRSILIDELTTSSPAVIVVERGDKLEWVTGNTRDSAQSLDEFPALSSMIAERYQRGPKLGKFDLFISNDVERLSRR
jgi:hypothetical protein